VDIGPLGNDAGEVLLGNKEMAEELNRKFMSVFMVEDISKIQESQGAEVSVVAITKKKMLKLKGLKVDK